MCFIKGMRVRIKPFLGSPCSMSFCGACLHACFCFYVLKQFNSAAGACWRMTCILVPAEQGQADKLTKPEAFFTGGLARAAAAAATCPFTVVKTRMEYTGSSVQYTVRDLQKVAQSKAHPHHVTVYCKVTVILKAITCFCCRERYQR